MWASTGMKHHPDLRAAVARTLARARAARRPPTVYDLFGSLIQTPDVHLMIHQTGGDADVLAAALESAASGLSRAGRLGRLWLRLAPDPSFGRVIAFAWHSKPGAKEEISPADVFAAGFDAGDRALVAVLESAGLSRTRVLAWLSGDPVGQGAAPAPEVPRVRGGFLAALKSRLTWRVLPADDVSSSDAVIAACGIAALAVWLAYDRYVAGASAVWYPVGLTGVTCYGAGLFALAWVLHRVSGTLVGFRSVLAPIVGWVPLALAGALALQWAPEQVQRPCLLLLALAGLVHASRVLMSVGASRPRAAMLAAAAFVAIFAWGTENAWVHPRLWYPDTDDDGPSAWKDSERLLFEQSDRVDAAVARMRPGDPDRPSVFFVGFAGTGEQKVFAEETKLAERVIAARYGAAGRTLLLVNDRRDLETWPLGTVHGLRRALGRLAERMDRSKDVLFLFLTSHGSAKPYLAVSNSTWPLEQLDAAALRKALDESGIRWRVVVISACHSGAFIPALADDQTAIFASAAADRASFGCSDDRDLTEFGAAFIRDAIPGAPSLTVAFDRAKAALAAEERRRNLPASLPQARIGAAISAQWARIESQHAPAPAKAHRE
jgi:hypothetical protein